jgi:uroporphyrinogen decarboxylase
MMTPYERVVTAVTCREPDRVPVLLLMPLQGAREFGMPLDQFLRDPAAMAEGQARLLERCGHDCVYAFSYGAAEAEAFGASTEFYPNGAPNVARPPLRDAAAAGALEPPDPTACEALARTLELIRLLAGRFKGRVPILANAIAPLSLPVMLLGMEHWLDLLLFGDPGLRDHLLQVCEVFCARWAQAQVAAGADAVGYFEPMASTEMTTPAQFRQFALPALRSVAPQVKAPLIFATAGGKNSARAAEIAEAGAAGIVGSAADDLGELKRQAGGRLAVAGNLNNIAMVAWDPAEAERQARCCLAAGAPGGGYLLCDQHGEIAWDTSPAVLAAIVEAAQRWGRYPLAPET